MNHIILVKVEESVTCILLESFLFDFEILFSFEYERPPTNH